MNYSYSSSTFLYTKYLNEIIVRLSKFGIPSHIRFITKKLPNNNNEPFFRIFYVQIEEKLESENLNSN